MFRFDLFYWGIVLLAVVNLAIQAWKSYAKPAYAYKYSRYPLLRGVELASLGGKRQYALGFLFYLAIIIGIFSFCVVFYGKIVDVGKDLEPFIGTGFPAKPASADSYAVPLAVSAAFSVVLSIEMFAEIESRIRGLAHRLAGIPREIYGVLTKLSNFPYSEHFPKSVSDSLKRTAKAITKQIEVCQDDELKEKLEELLHNIYAIGVLLPSVTGESGDTLWNQLNIETVNDFVSGMEGDKRTLVDKTSALLKAITNGEHETNNDQDTEDRIDTIDAVVAESSVLKANLFSVFALLFISQNDVQIPDHQFAARRVIAHLRQDARDTLWDSFVGSIIFGTPVAMLLSATGLALLRTIDQPADPQLLKSSGAVGYFLNVFPASTVDAAITTLQVVLIFAITIGNSLSVRVTLMETDRWDPWQVLPFSRYATASIAPLIFAVFACQLYYYVVYIAKISFVTGWLAASALSAFWFTYGLMPSMQALAGVAFCGLFFVVADWHDNLKMRYTMAIGIVCALVYATVVGFVDAILVDLGSVVSGRYARHDIMQHFLASTSLSLFFCFFVEKFEKYDNALADEKSKKKTEVRSQRCLD
ncbi:hypothetical protein NKH10_28280 [Mesorhizobium sp. M1340]|uniref:hypothetical protein n=1 Tax=unclassified Mesorhizobium TaxID=325217 RepID=UPI00333DECBF